MTTTLPLPRTLRNPSWVVALLLPVIPLLLAQWHDDSLFGQDAIYAIPWALLLVIGLVVAMGIPAVLDKLGWAIRKEAEQLRPAWLAGLFVAQVTGAFGVDGIPLAGLVFGFTCALVAAFTFGTEFQQRTMSALLSQPVDRRHLWSTKMGVLGVALVTHFLVFQLSLHGSGMSAITSADAQAAVATAGITFAILAWSTTPTWTLITRSAIAGLVFSVAAPFVTFAILAALDRESSFATSAGLALVLPYSVVVFELGRRRWLRLETPDEQGESMGALFTLPRRTTDGARSSRAGWVRRIVAKEFRLQTVTFATGLITLVLLGLKSVSTESVGRRELFQALVFLFGGITILLAGATPIAEERRLGTLAEQVLRPASIRSQWWLKLGVGALPAAVAFLAMLGAVNWGGEPDLRVVGLAVLVAFSAFAFSLHASSGASNTLWALLSGMVVTAVCGVLVTAAAAMVAEMGSSISERVWNSLASEPQLWIEEAARNLPPMTSPALGAWENRWQDHTIHVLSTWLPILAALFCSLGPVLSLVFARSNFAQPAGAPQRLLRQQGWIFGLLASVALIGGATALQALRGIVRADCLAQTVRHLDIERHLSPAQLQLRRHRLSEVGQTITVAEHIIFLIRVFENRTGNDASPATPRKVSRTFRLPLSAADREQLIEACDLPPAIKNALIAEAQAGSPQAPATRPQP